jgi:hypothetical protein
MKPTLLFLFIATVFTTTIKAQVATAQYKVVTIVESIVPGGMGRSRIIEAKMEDDIKASSGERNSGSGSKQAEGKRRNLKTDDFIETKLLNFYSLIGINFQNIASNDAMIAAKITEMSTSGWKLSFVSTGVESNAGAQDGEGIFITRLIFYQ